MTNGGTLLVRHLSAALIRQYLLVFDQTGVAWAKGVEDGGRSPVDRCRYFVCVAEPMIS